MSRLLSRQRLLTIATCIAASLSLVSATLAGDNARLAASLVDADRVLVIAHRGDSATHPENTLAAFASAIEQKSDLVELDYHHSQDHVPVVLHDFSLDRTTDARQKFQTEKIAVASKSLADLMKLDAGSWFSADYTGQKLPTLAESLDVIQAGSITLIERKSGEPKPCLDLLRKHDLIDNVVVQAFDWKYVTECHAMEPQLILAALGKDELTSERLDKLEATGARIVAWHQGSLDKDSIERIHARNLRAWCYTVDDPKRILELVDAGIDGIITNRPGETRKLVESREALAK